MPRFAPEGYPFFAVFAVLTAVAYLAWGRWAAIPLVILTVFMFYFFRDPERTIPQKAGVYLAPADGKVIVAEEIREDDYLKSDCLLVSIFMSPLNVHVNRAPCDGVVRLVKYNKGSFKSAFSHEAFRKNENIAMVIEEPGGENILVRQVAGSIAQKAVCRKKPGETLEKGERFGIIKFSSRVDIYLPPDVRLLVSPGERVVAGESIIAEKR